MQSLKEAMMGRKVGLTAAAAAVVVLSVVLVGGSVGGGFLWWGAREPIYIYGNSGFTVENGVTGGSGTAADPYIIEGWRVDDPTADYGIYIDHTTAHFVIRDCVIERARIAGIYLNSVRNGRIEGVQIALSDTAVHLLNAQGNEFVGNVFAECKYGVVTAADSRGNRIYGNSFLDNGIHGYDPNRWNEWSDPSGGNYWSDYEGVDADGDGFGDRIYAPLRDPRPLMRPPVEWTRIEPAGSLYAGSWVSPDGTLVVTSRTPITLAAVDPGSGVAEIRYSINDGPWAVYDGPIHLSGPDGVYRLAYHAVDRLGNAEPVSRISFILDNHPPVTAIEFGAPSFEDARGVWLTSSTPITLRLEQRSTHGVTQTFYRIDGGNWRRYDVPFRLVGPDGPRRIDYYSQNASGVTEETKTIVVLKDDVPPTTRGSRAAVPPVDVEVGAPVGSAPPAEPPQAAPDEPDVEPSAAPDSEPPAVESPPPVIVVETSPEPQEQTPSATVEEPVTEPSDEPASSEEF